MSKDNLGNGDFFSDDGIFSVKERTCYEYSEKCCHCGYELLCGEDALVLNNGDVIHESCWTDYADENIDTFGRRIVYSDGNDE